MPPATKSPGLPFETAALRGALRKFFASPFQGWRLGSYRWGVYAFFDYDGEPIYVGQTYEGLSSRVSRHLTNQRTDAVAMSVLDPFEVREIEVWPLPQFQEVTKDSASAARTAARRVLDGLEYEAFQRTIAASKFKAILNEKEPTPADSQLCNPSPVRGLVVSDDIFVLRGHPDVRIARRAQTLARLAQVISERHVQYGLRRTLLTQAKRLQWLARSRLESISPTEVADDEDAD